MNNPLCPGIFLPRHERTDIWISLKYERLLEFCFRCGIIGHTDVHCETNKVVLTNEFGGKFTAFGEWLHSGNDKIPPGIYDKPSVMPVPALMQAGPMLEETPPALVQYAPMVNVVVPEMETAVQCEDNPRTAGIENLARSRISTGNQSGEVSSFARLLEHALKNACRDSKASTSLSHMDTFLDGASKQFALETKPGHLVGPYNHTNPQSPVNIQLIKHLPTVQPNVLIEPTVSNVDCPSTDPLEAHQLTLSIQSHVLCSLEPPLNNPTPHATNHSEHHGTKYKNNFPIFPKVVIPDPLSPTLVNPAAPTPIKQADPHSNPTNQTTFSQDLISQVNLGTHDLKRKDHPKSPCTTPKKKRHEDDRLDVKVLSFGNSNYLLMRLVYYTRMWKAKKLLLLWLRRRDCTCLLRHHEDYWMELSRDL